ncbi:MAG: dihydroorotase, partial [Burkholderiales bacterium]
ILALLPADTAFQPLMTLYLTDHTAPAEVTRAHNSGFVNAVKLYPAGATTHAHAGVTDIENCQAVFEEMQKLDVPLLVHAEVTDPGVDVFDREKIFIERHLNRLVARFPRLRVVLEHVTTRLGVEFVVAARPGVAATITAHHLLLNRNALFAGGLRPHNYCLPLLKREDDRQALIAAATGGGPRFFLGTDSAPHARSAKESACGCAGIYSAHAAIELYAEVFEQAGALDKLEAFASFHGADFYRLPRNAGRITLEKRAWRVPQTIAFADGELVPLRAGEHLSWKMR